MHGPNIAPEVDNLTVALEMAAAGLPVFPAEVTFDEKKQQWQKKPHIKDWQKEATTDARTLRYWWSEWPDAVPGIELGRANLILLDPDRHGGEDGVANFRALVEQHDPLADHPLTPTAGDGEHHYFTQPNGIPFTNAEGDLKGRGINVRGKGGWAVAPGALRSDGKRWGPTNLATAYYNKQIPVLPAWLANMIRPPRKSKRSAKPPLWTSEEMARVEAALRYIPSDDRTTWLEIGAALHHTSWNAARAIWDAWSQTTPSAFDPDDQEKTWRSFDRPYAGKLKTLASLFHLAQMHGYRPEYSTRREPPPEPEPAAPTAEPVELFDPWGRYVVPPFPVEILPPTLRHFVTAQSELIGCERGALAMTALAAVSGALDHRFALKMLRNGDWWVSHACGCFWSGIPVLRRLQSSGARRRNSTACRRRHSADTRTMRRNTWQRAAIRDNSACRPRGSRSTTRRSKSSA